MTIDKLYLGSRWDNTWTTLASWTYPGGFDRNAIHKMRVEFYGNSIKCYVDDEEKISISNSSYSTGEVGFLVHNANVRLDDFEIRNDKSYDMV